MKNNMAMYTCSCEGCNNTINHLWRGSVVVKNGGKSWVWNESKGRYEQGYTIYEAPTCKSCMKSGRTA